MTTQPNTCNLTISGTAPPFTINADNPDPTPNQNKHVKFVMGSSNWSFENPATVPPKYASYRNFGCGICVDDPNNNFNVVNGDTNTKTIKLKDSKGDKASMPDHPYALFMTDGTNHLVYDPVIKDGNNLMTLEEASA